LEKIGPGKDKTELYYAFFLEEPYKLDRDLNLAYQNNLKGNFLKITITIIVIANVIEYSIIIKRRYCCYFHLNCLYYLKYLFDYVSELNFNFIIKEQTR
jgi:hypothetical protein